MKIKLSFVRKRFKIIFIFLLLYRVHYDDTRLKLFKIRIKCYRLRISLITHGSVVLWLDNLTVWIFGKDAVDILEQRTVIYYNTLCKSNDNVLACRNTHVYTAVTHHSYILIATVIPNRRNTFIKIIHLLKTMSKTMN